MASLNRVDLIGNIGQKPEVKYMPNGDAVVNISIATSKKWTDKSGEKKEHTEWHRVVFFGRLAEVIGEYCDKGSPIYVEGELRTRSYEKEGQKHYATEVQGLRLQLLGGKGGGRSSDDDGEAAGEPGSRRAPAKPQGVSNPSGGQSDFDDDIPF
jgi:single-strand DNA-binding protein